MNDVEFIKLLKETNDQVIRKEMIINGLQATGLKPFNLINLNCDSLLRKSPEYIFDFKGDILNLTEIEMPSEFPVHSSDSSLFTQNAK